jgi:hypothetical protein
MVDTAVRVVVRVLDHRQKIAATADYYGSRRFSADRFITDHARQDGRNDHRRFSWRWLGLTLRLTPRNGVMLGVLCGAPVTP